MSMPDIIELSQLIDDLVDLRNQLEDKGDWAASRALDKILDETWIRSWRFD